MWQSNDPTDLCRMITARPPGFLPGNASSDAAESLLRSLSRGDAPSSQHLPTWVPQGPTTRRGAGPRAQLVLPPHCPNLLQAAWGLLAPDRKSVV